MLANVLGVPASELSAKAIEELASLGRSEDQYLEFKEQLPERDRDALQRIAQAVVGMANSAGGLIVFGVAEKEGVATHAHPVDISDRADALPKSLSSRIQPRVDGLRWHHIPKDSPARGYLVLEVPPSPLRPHFIVDGASLAATKRVN